jgi:hypothetical protein
MINWKVITFKELAKTVPEKHNINWITKQNGGVGATSSQEILDFLQVWSETLIRNQKLPGQLLKNSSIETKIQRYNECFMLTYGKPEILSEINDTFWWCRGL